MKNIVVIFGGRAVEHEVSVITGMQAVENLNKNKYNVIPVYISKDGEMFTGESYKSFKSFKENNFADKKNVRFGTDFGDHNLYIEGNGLFKKTEKINIDCVVMGVHGSHSEDGALQGIFETNGIPFTGPSVVSSAVGMDKILMKDVYKSHDIPVVNYDWFFRAEFENNSNEVLDKVIAKLSFPIFVKPASLGSSIGISVAHNREELRNNIEVACSFDRKIIVEEAVGNPTELNCAVMGAGFDVEASPVEIADTNGEMYTFEGKYEGSKSKITGGKHRFLEDPEMVERAKKLATESFKSIDARGNARVDLLMDADKNLYVNEINTLPGSFAFYLWEEVGYTFSSVLDRMIEIALKASEDDARTNYKFDADLFNKTGYGSKL